jgi:hypothetical protein
MIGFINQKTARALQAFFEFTDFFGISFLILPNSSVFLADKDKTKASLVAKPWLSNIYLLFICR